MGSTPFRVRTVPDPIATVAGRDGGVIGRNVLLAQTGVLAEMKDFDFDLTFTVQSFTVSSVQGGFLVDQRSNSNRLTDAQKDIIRNAPRNARIFFDDIVATGVAGERRLPTISFRID
jgi:hypothetical protein